jgi:hypothetical protein
MRICSECRYFEQLDASSGGCHHHHYEVRTGDTCSSWRDGYYWKDETQEANPRDLERAMPPKVTEWVEELLFEVADDYLEELSR